MGLSDATVRGSSRRVALVCAWCGPVFLVVFVVGFWFVAGLVPPPKPSDNAAQIAIFYRENTDRIRVGMLLSMVATALLAPFGHYVGDCSSRATYTARSLVEASTRTGTFATLVWIST